jgi:hypothetical protein
MANQLSSAASLKLWFGWVIANTIGGAIGAWLGESFSNLGNLDPNSLLRFFLLGLGISVPISLCQGIFLAGKIPKILKWIVASSVVSTLCIGFSPFLITLLLFATSEQGEDLYFGVFGLMSGLSIGVAQWLLVLKKIPGSSRWVLFSSLGSAIGLGIGTAMANSQGRWFFAWYTDHSLSKLLLMGTVARLLYGMITGIVLVQILQKNHIQSDF